MILCVVLDTSLILERFQPSSDTSKSLIDALYQNPKIELHLPYAYISEIIAEIYVAHRESQKTHTPMSIIERAEIINRLRKDIKDKKLIPYPATESLFAKSEDIFNASFTISPKGRDPIDIPDMLVIATALELKGLTELVNEVYLFSADYHLNKTATTLGIQCYDSSKISLGELPDCFNRRMGTRRTAKLKITCKDCETSIVYGPTKTINVCEYGLCAEMPPRQIEQGRRINMNISSYNVPENKTETNGVVVWSQGDKLGIEFEEPIELDSLIS